MNETRNKIERDRRKIPPRSKEKIAKERNRSYKRSAERIEEKF